MPRNVLQTLTVVALVAAIFFVAHNFVRYILRVHGGYSEWTEFTECTKSCGTGTRFRTRTCDNPSPRFGGLDCSILGEDIQTFKCNMILCPVDGGYGAWSNFGECSVTCGDGIQQRERRCDSPEPMFGGMNCEQLELGPSIETKACNLESCPVNGGYGQWSEFGDCSVSCGGGEQKRERKCDSPEPMFGGLTCEDQKMGPYVESQPCNDEPCPIDGGYSEWTEFSECTVTCGGGTHQRTRECNNPAPANGGKNCVEPDTESEECNTQACPTQPPAQSKQQKNSDEESKDIKSENDEKKQGDEGSEEKKDEAKEGNEEENKKEDENKPGNEDENKEDDENKPGNEDENKKEDENKPENEDENKEEDENKPGNQEENKKEDENKQ